MTAGNDCLGKVLARVRVGKTLLLQFLNLPLQAGIAASQDSKIANVNDPRGGVRSVEIAHRVAPGSIRSCKACASSTSRFTTSNRYRDQETTKAKHMNASQLIIQTCSIRGSIE